MAKFTCNFILYTLKCTVDITVVIPSPTIPDSMGMSGGPCSHTPKEKYPVLYLLHGMGNNHATWTGYTNVELFAEELPYFVCGMFPVSREPKHTYISGLSMGGYGTLVHALNHPERFKAFGAFSAAVQLNPEALVSGGADATAQKPADPSLDPASLAEKLAKEGKAFPKA